MATTTIHCYVNLTSGSASVTLTPGLTFNAGISLAAPNIIEDMQLVITAPVNATRFIKGSTGVSSFDLQEPWAGGTLVGAEVRIATSGAAVANLTAAVRDLIGQGQSIIDASGSAVVITQAAQSVATNALAAQASAATALNASNAVTALIAAQQDLSGVTAAALHRSPNPIAAMCIYDASKDSDGGAWIERCQALSWYNEPLCGAWRGACASEADCRAISGAGTGDYFQNTTDGLFYKLSAGAGVTPIYRGNKAKFPRLAAIVAEDYQVVIYDLTQPGWPMWFVACNGTIVGSGAVLGDASFRITSTQALQSEVVLGCSNGAYGGLMELKFLADSIRISRRWPNDPYSGVYENVARRHIGRASPFFIPGGLALIDDRINCVAITVLPDAPIDLITGLAVPTIVVATAGGVSVIKHDGTVVHLTCLSPDYTYADQVAWAGAKLCFILSCKQLADDCFYHVVSLPNASIAAYQNVAFQGGEYYRAQVGTGTSSSVPAILQPSNQANQTVGSRFLGAPATQAVSHNAGATFLRRNSSDAAKGLAAYVTSAYATGYMPGDVRRALLCDTVTGIVTGSGDLVADRSVQAKSATVYGALTKAAVAAAAQLVAYSGFSAANYLQEPYSADLDFGTGDFYAMAWVKPSSVGAAQTLLDRSDSTSSTPRWRLSMTAAGYLDLTIVTSAGVQSVTTSLALDTSCFSLVAALKRGAVLELWVNGVLWATAPCAGAGTLSNALGCLAVGVDAVDHTTAFSGSLALVRLGADAPFAEALAWMYAQELPMFSAGAQVTLPAAAPVTDLAYDADLDKWVAVQAGNRSTWTGLVRTASSVPSAGTFTKVCAASGIELAARATATPGVDLTMPSLGMREEIIRGRAIPPDKPIKVEFDAVAGQTTFVLPRGYTTKEVSSAGAIKRLGATKDYTTAFDGFRESVVFLVAPGAGVWVSVLAVRG